MESLEKRDKDIVLKNLQSTKNDRTGTVAKHLHNTFKVHNCLQSSVSCSECSVGSCPNLTMSRNEQPESRQPESRQPESRQPESRQPESRQPESRQPESRPSPIALTPQLPPRTHRPLCLSISSDSNGRFKALETQEWKNNLKAQMEQAHSAGAASSTGSLERASLFCASSSTNTPSSGLSSPVETLTKSKSSSRFSLFSPPWNSSSESDSNPPSRSGSKKLRNYSRRGGAGGPEPKPSGEEHFHYSEPVISKVTDYIYVGNLNAAYSGRTLCRNNIDSIIDMSSLPGEAGLCLIPCTCTRGAKHSWSRLKVEIGDLSAAAAESPVHRQRCFEDINECIDASTEKRKRVLVHCRDGYSLAPACIIQYLMVRQNMRLIAAYELLRAKYPVNIRECHQNVLVSLERALRPGGNVDPECFKQAISRKVAWT